MEREHTGSSSDGRVQVYDFTIPARFGRKVVVVVTDGVAEVRYDQNGTLHGRKFSSLEEFERVAYRK